MLSFNDFVKRFDKFRNRFDATNIGIPRKEMPQLDNKDIPGFLKWLKTEHGADSKTLKKKVEEFNYTQSELNFEKILGMTSQKPKAIYDPVVMSSDGYVMDGHHRIAARALIDELEKATVNQVNMDIRNLLDKAKEYSKVSTKKLKEGWGG